MKLRDMKPGDRFRLPDSGRTGVLVSLGAMAARVIYDGAARQVAFTARNADESTDVSFEKPGGVVLISDHTEGDVTV